MSGDTLRVVARVIARPGSEEELRGVLQGLIAPTRQEAGCLVYQLQRNEEDPADFVFVEEWTDGEALDAHLASAHFQTAAEQLGELLAEPPDIRKYRVIG